MRRIIHIINILKNKTFPNLLINNLRILIAFGFIPSGIRKINNQPFTRIENTGPFYDYLDALHNTGFYYQFIGYGQVLAALLLFSYRFSTLGAIVYFSIILNICVFTISTNAGLTAVIATLMLLACILLLLWDFNRLKPVFSKNPLPIPEVEIKQEAIWEKTGLLLIVNTFVLFFCGKLLERQTPIRYILLSINWLLFLVIPVAASILFIIKRKINR